MAKQTIDRGVVGGVEYEVGQRVCVAGRGTAAILHQHGRVQRFTATMMVVLVDDGRSGSEWRYRLGSTVSLSVGVGGYGGTYVAPKCQRPRKA